METRAEQNIRIFILGEILTFQHLFSSKIRMEMLKYLLFQRMNMFSATFTLKWIWQRCYNISWELLLRYFVLRTVLTRDISFGLLNQNCKKCLGSGTTFIWFLFPLRLFNPCIPFSNWKKQNPTNTKQTKKDWEKKILFCSEKETSFATIQFEAIQECSGFFIWSSYMVLFMVKLQNEKKVI